MALILASASPRRKELLSYIADGFEIIPSEIAEVAPAGLTVLKHPQYLSALKAMDIAKKYPDDIVIGADTAVILGNKI